MIDFKEKAAELVAANINIKKEEVIPLIEIPPQEDLGDYALPCFQFARTLRKAPQLIAEELVAAINQGDYFAEVKNVGPYLNFFIKRELLAKTVLEAVLSAKDNFGSSRLGAGKNVVIDFSSPNIAKPFHVGHLRSTVIGNSLYRINQFLGYHCIGINHLGDWGTQFGKLIAAYQLWGNEQEIKAEPIPALLKLYVKFHQEAENNLELEEKGRQCFKRLEEGDHEAAKLWEWFVELSLTEFNKIYQLLNVHFDYTTGESFYNDKMDGIVQLLQEKKLLKNSKGAYVVDLDEYEMPPCLILKSDGATLYPTRDITAAIYRKENYHFAKALYVTDYSQNLHFAQWFKVIELLGFDWSDQLEHVPFGRVSTEEGALKTRKGNVIFLKDLLNKAIEKARKIIEENNSTLENKDEIAAMVGIGAVIFNDLSNSKIKDIVFNWERMLSFDGETGPYVQYTHARANSVLKKGQSQSRPLDDYSALTSDEAFAVLKLLYTFPATVRKAAARNEPFFITRQIVELAQAFNKFYHQYPILVDEVDLKESRLLLVLAVKTVLKTGLYLLGIQAPERM